MADTITSGATVLTLSDGFDLVAGAETAVNSVVHIPLTNLNFIRREGSAGRQVVATGRQTFTTLADAQTFQTDLAKLPATTCTIEHDSLTPPGGLVADCVKHNSPPVQSNQEPGFHIDYSIEFQIL